MVVGLECADEQRAECEPHHIAGRRRWKHLQRDESSRHRERQWGLPNPRAGQGHQYCRLSVGLMENRQVGCSMPRFVSNTSTWTNRRPIFSREQLGSEFDLWDNAVELPDGTYSHGHEHNTMPTFSLGANYEFTRPYERLCARQRRRVLRQVRRCPLQRVQRLERLSLESASQHRAELRRRFQDPESLYVHRRSDLRQGIQGTVVSAHRFEPCPARSEVGDLRLHVAGRANRRQRESVRGLRPPAAQGLQDHGQCRVREGPLQGFPGLLLLPGHQPNNQCAARSMVNSSLACRTSRFG